MAMHKFSTKLIRSQYGLNAYNVCHKSYIDVSTGYDGEMKIPYQINPKM